MEINLTFEIFPMGVCIISGWCSSSIFDPFPPRTATLIGGLSFVDNPASLGRFDKAGVFSTSWVRVPSDDLVKIFNIELTFLEISAFQNLQTLIEVSFDSLIRWRTKEWEPVTDKGFNFAPHLRNNDKTNKKYHK